MKRLILGNWKMHGSHAMAQALVHDLQQIVYDKLRIEVGVLPPFVYLSEVRHLLVQSQIVFGAQNISEYESGAYTGEIAGSMLQELGCKYVLVGHSERRHIFGETNAQVAEKFWRAMAHDLIPVLCVGETLEQREAGQTEAVIASQLQAVFTEDKNLTASHYVVAYEPVWAIGTGKAATLQQVQEVHQFILKQLSTISDRLQVLYGGSVKADNAKDILAIKEVHGVLVGGASLDAKQFGAIIQAA